MALMSKLKMPTANQKAKKKPAMSEQDELDLELEESEEDPLMSEEPSDELDLELEEEASSEEENPLEAFSDEELLKEFKARGLQTGKNMDEDEEEETEEEEEDEESGFSKAVEAVQITGSN